MAAANVKQKNAAQLLHFRQNSQSYKLVNNNNDERVRPRWAGSIKLISSVDCLSLRSDSLIKNHNRTDSCNLSPFRIVLYRSLNELKYVGGLDLVGPGVFDFLKT